MTTEHERLVMPCWIKHDFGKWTDTHKITKTSAITGGTINRGVQQEKRCKKCGMLKIRTVWAE